MEVTGRSGETGGLRMSKRLIVVPAHAGPSVFAVVEKIFHTYILASRRNGTLYVGVTSNLLQRVWQHKNGFVDGFTRKYGVKSLVWFEQHDDAESAIAREKQLKNWNREWKIKLIEEKNPYWNDLYHEII